eukprot:TRINITY_DN18665_c0_g1_i1.p2 TRINITY_DN18665_c0_g1~~TRINITY_DN18665_c0_g1_i1.p2  ORF type:complete len:101 (-),score=4.36 TRINITY_DN18665_c0_g1_i1:148-450(-)
MMTRSSQDCAAIIQSFPKNTAYGSDGLQAQHLLDALCGPATTAVRTLEPLLVKIVDLLLQRPCSRELSPSVVRGPLTDLSKSDGGCKTCYSGPHLQVVGG